jgi:hypothetical protein
VRLSRAPLNQVYNKNYFEEVYKVNKYCFALNNGRPLALPWLPKIFPAPEAWQLGTCKAVTLITKCYTVIIIQVVNCL